MLLDCELEAQFDGVNNLINWRYVDDAGYSATSAEVLSLSLEACQFCSGEVAKEKPCFVCYTPYCRGLAPDGRVSSCHLM